MPGTFSYNAGTNTITVTGGTEALPADLASMYAADQASGWGVVTNPCQGVYQIACKLLIGDGTTSTYFKDVLKTMVIPDGVFTANNQYYCQVKSNATFQLGNLISDSLHTTKDGCQIFHQAITYYGHRIFYTSAGIVNLYSTSIMGTGGFAGRSSIEEGGTGVLRIWNCLINGSITPTRIVNGSIYNLITCYCSTSIDSCAGTLDNIICISPLYYAVQFYSTYHSILRNLKSRSPGLAFLRPYGISVDQYIIDADTDAWSISWGSTNTGKIYRQNTIDLHVTDKDGNNISGASVVLRDAAENEIFSLTTGADGKIAEQTVSRGYYDQAHAAVLQDYGPHTLTITADGYQDYQDVITLDRKMDLEVAMAEMTTAGGGVTPTSLGLVPLGIKQVAV